MHGSFLVHMPTWNLSTGLTHYWTRIESTYNPYNAKANANMPFYFLLVYFKHYVMFKCVN